VRLKLFVLQTVGTAATLAAAWLLLLVPDSSAAWLALSLLLMYVTLFLLSFTLTAVTGGLGHVGAELAPPGAGRCLEVLSYGWRRWYRAAILLLAAGGLLYAVIWLGWLRLPVWLGLAVVVLLAIPSAVQWHSLQAVRFAAVARNLACILLALALGFAAWKIVDAPLEMSRPWLEVAYLGARMLASFLALNAACMLLLSAGRFDRRPSADSAD
jgi:hypothetical protein